jgi:hypothetical protein
MPVASILKEVLRLIVHLLDHMPYQIILRLSGARKDTPDAVHGPFGVSEKSTEELQRSVLGLT